ncbi:MAG: cupin domain-containing protein [Flavobacteriales bacterium]|nr:cupin domain-containing protein [Flavobacteriales bacterium]
MINTLEGIVKKLNLLPHPEGGYYRETYRADPFSVPPKELGIDKERNLSTAIYFLLTKGNFSAFHRIKQDEVWHHYLGDAIAIHCISPEGAYEKLLLGKEFENGELPQHVVTGGTWFASETLGEYSLAGCTVAPGFDFADFEMAERTILLSYYSEHRDVITALTRNT